MSGFDGLFKPLLNHGESTLARGDGAVSAALREIVALGERIATARSDAMRSSAMAEADGLDHGTEADGRPTLLSPRGRCSGNACVARTTSLRHQIFRPLTWEARLFGDGADGVATHGRSRSGGRLTTGGCRAAGAGIGAGAIGRSTPGKRNGATVTSSWTAPGRKPRGCRRGNEPVSRHLSRIYVLASTASDHHKRVQPPVQEPGAAIATNDVATGRR
jgi:hypothetical protein